MTLFYSLFGFVFVARRGLQSQAGSECGDGFQLQWIAGMDTQNAGGQIVKTFSFVNKQSLKQFKALPGNILEPLAADLNETCKGTEPLFSIQIVCWQCRY